MRRSRQMARRPSAMDRRKAFWNHTSSMASFPDDRKGRLLGSNRMGRCGVDVCATPAMALRLVQSPAFPTCMTFTAAIFKSAISRPGTRNRSRKHRNRILCAARLLPPASSLRWATFTLLRCTGKPVAPSKRRYFRRINALENDSYISIALICPSSNHSPSSGHNHTHKMIDPLINQLNS